MGDAINTYKEGRRTVRLNVPIVAVNLPTDIRQTRRLGVQLRRRAGGFLVLFFRCGLFCGGGTRGRIRK